LSNLDAQLRLEMRAEISRIVKENDLTGIYVTHDQAEALSMADRMAVMDEGEVKQVGPPEEIYRRPVSSHVAGFIGETNILPGLAREKGQVEVAGGVLAATPTVDDWHPSAGESVLLSIRPESLEIVRPEQGELIGKVASRVYLGSFVQYGVTLEDGTAVRVTEQNPQEIREVGESRVGLKVARNDAMILPT
jgi:iron(III) transport system ATP-binding protein